MLRIMEIGSSSSPLCLTEDITLREWDATPSSRYSHTLPSVRHRPSGRLTHLESCTYGNALRPDFRMVIHRQIFCNHVRPSRPDLCDVHSMSGRKFIPRMSRYSGTATVRHSFIDHCHLRAAAE